ncbi:hypothetical protein PR048_004877 [Dryococelus australis]|uniref:Uncharacterized protein n=1 Tax=Dryococelus australis TaxID=614101 RepID=A0ABQ9I740_9NEOP|nr:hypothetical protein PR048_004877 [Dryococelus australis]
MVKRGEVPNSREGKRENPEKTRRPAAESSTIPTYEYMFEEDWKGRSDTHWPRTVAWPANENQVGRRFEAVPQLSCGGVCGKMAREIARPRRRPSLCLEDELKRKLRSTTKKAAKEIYECAFVQIEKGDELAVSSSDSESNTAIVRENISSEAPGILTSGDNRATAEDGHFHLQLVDSACVCEVNGEASQPAPVGVVAGANFTLQPFPSVFKHHGRNIYLKVLDVIRQINCRDNGLTDFCILQKEQKSLLNFGDALLDKINTALGEDLVHEYASSRSKRG